MSTPNPYFGQYPSAPTERWYNPRGPAGALTVLLIITAAANALLIVALIGLRARVDQYADGTADLDDVDNMIGLAGFVFLVVTGLIIAVFVLTVVWQWRLAKNHQLLGRPDTPFGPGWAIGAWFIPLANLVIPILQFRDLWKGSAPGLRRGSPDWKRQSTAALLWVWWGLFVASFLTDWASSAIVDEEAEELVELTGQLDRTTGLAVLAYSLRIGAAILFIFVVKQLTARQEAAVAEAVMQGPLVSTGSSWPAGSGAPGTSWSPGAPWSPSPGTAPPGLSPYQAPGMPLAPPGEPSPGWKLDPTGRAEHRYWDGVRWTDHASIGGNAFLSPL